MIKLRCAKCGEWRDSLRAKAGRLLCDECAKPPAVAHWKRAIIAELALRRTEWNAKH